MAIFRNIKNRVQLLFIIEYYYRIFKIYFDFDYNSTKRTFRNLENL